jgi:branched-subunit amino acid aminotransferase/4-amino-4-deoxychorismate lyase
MHPFVSFNNQILRAENASISAAASAALYGKGVFTTLAIRAAQPFLWEKHWRRLNENAKKLEINLAAFDKEIIENSLKEIIEINKLTNGRARITFFDENSTDIWNFDSDKKTSFLITTADTKPVSQNLRLTVSPYRVNSASPLAGVKSCNYLEKTLALNDAKKRGFDEAIQFNENGAIVSACMANIFWLSEKKLYTPSLAAGCLAGTTREFLLEDLKSGGKFECVKSETDLQSLRNADAIFLTSAGLNIAQIAEFDGRIYERKYPQITGIIDSI